MKPNRARIAEADVALTTIAAVATAVMADAGLNRAGNRQHFAFVWSPGMIHHPGGPYCLFSIATRIKKTFSRGFGMALNERGDAAPSLQRPDVNWARGNWGTATFLITAH